MKVKPKNFKQLDKEFNAREKDAHMNKVFKSVSKKNTVEKQQKVLMIEYTKINPCIQAKLAIEWEPF